MVAPCLTMTVNVAESPVALPAVPVKVGARVFTALLLAGAVTVTPVGAVVSMVKVLAVLVVELPAVSVWVAVTV